MTGLLIMVGSLALLWIGGRLYSGLLARHLGDDAVGGAIAAQHQLDG